MNAANRLCRPARVCSRRCQLVRSGVFHVVLQSCLATGPVGGCWGGLGRAGEGGRAADDVLPGALPAPTVVGETGDAPAAVAHSVQRSRGLPAPPTHLLFRLSFLLSSPAPQAEWGPFASSASLVTSRRFLACPPRAERHGNDHSLHGKGASGVPRASRRSPASAGHPQRVPGSECPSPATPMSCLVVVRPRRCAWRRLGAPSAPPQPAHGSGDGARARRQLRRGCSCAKL